MANCSTNCGCGSGCSACGSSSCNGYGALNSLRQSGGQFPFYTGPCPAAPCTGCGCNTGGCTDCNCSHPCGCDADCGRNTCSRCGGKLNCSGVCTGCGHHCGCDRHCSWSRCPGCGGALNGSGVCTGCGYRCGRDADCGWNSGRSRCGWQSWNGAGSWDRPHYAVFSLGGPLSLAPGGTVELLPRDCNTDLFDIENGQIVIRAPGFYYAAVTVDIPQGAEVSTTMRLSLDNRPMLPPQIAVTTDGGSATANFAGHTVFWAGPGSVLNLETQEALEISGATAQPVFTLTLFRL